MKIELDELDKDFLSRSHSQEEWRREHEAALLRCAAYWRDIEDLRQLLRDARMWLPPNANGVGQQIDAALRKMGATP